MPLIERNIPGCLTAEICSLGLSTSIRNKDTNLQSASGTVTQIRILSDHADKIFDDLTALMAFFDERIDHLLGRVSRELSVEYLSIGHNVAAVADAAVSNQSTIAVAVDKSVCMAASTSTAASARRLNNPSLLPHLRHHRLVSLYAGERLHRAPLLSHLDCLTSGRPLPGPSGGLSEGPPGLCAKGFSDPSLFFVKWQSQQESHLAEMQTERSARRGERKKRRALEVKGREDAKLKRRASDIPRVIEWKKEMSNKKQLQKIDENDVNEDDTSNEREEDSRQESKEESDARRSVASAIDALKREAHSHVTPRISVGGANPPPKPPKPEKPPRTLSFAPTLEKQSSSSSEAEGGGGEVVYETSAPPLSAPPPPPPAPPLPLSPSGESEDTATVSSQPPPPPPPAPPGPPGPPAIKFEQNEPQTENRPKSLRPKSVKFSRGFLDQPVEQGTTAPPPPPPPSTLPPTSLSPVSEEQVGGRDSTTRSERVGERGGDIGGGSGDNDNNGYNADNTRREIKEGTPITRPVSRRLRPQSVDMRRSGLGSLEVRRSVTRPVSSIQNNQNNHDHDINNTTRNTSCNTGNSAGESAEQSANNGEDDASNSASSPSKASSPLITDRSSIFAAIRNRSEGSLNKVSMNDHQYNGQNASSRSIGGSTDSHSPSRGGRGEGRPSLGMLGGSAVSAILARRKYLQDDQASDSEKDSDDDWI